LPPTTSNQVIPLPATAIARPRNGSDTTPTVTATARPTARERIGKGTKTAATATSRPSAIDRPTNISRPTALRRIGGGITPAVASPTATSRPTASVTACPTMWRHVVAAAARATTTVSLLSLNPSRV